MDSPDVYFNRYRLVPVSTAAATTATATATTSSWLLWTSFIDGQRATTQLSAVQRGNGCLRFRIRGHLHESKTAGLACKLICDNPGRCHRSMRSKQIAQLLL